ncbi:MAG TPA: CopG family transcriptional regulator [Bryobacteraceae bacterium]
MRRTQLYLDDDLRNTLHSRARSKKTTLSELVREAVRERYFGPRDERMKAMQEFVGVRKGLSGSTESDAVRYVQNLRRERRLERLERTRKG